MSSNGWLCCCAAIWALVRLDTNHFRGYPESREENQMERTIAGIHEPRLRGLRPVLKRWIALNKEVASAWQGSDVPWWYSERACLSIFAGAVWRGGHIVLEEYSTDKKSSRGRRRLYAGRNDIYFRVGSTDYIGEAKAKWFGGSNIQREGIKKIAECLNWACADIRKCPPNGQRRVGIAFIQPYFRKKKEV